MNYIKTANLDLAIFLATDYKIDSLNKLINNFVIIYDGQQLNWSYGKTQRSELMSVAKEWICHNFLNGNYNNVECFLKSLPLDLRQQFLLSICEGFKDYKADPSHSDFKDSTEIEEACVLFIENLTNLQIFFRQPYKNWNSFQAYPGKFLVYAVAGGIKKIVDIFVELGFYKLYYDHLFTIRGDSHNFVYTACVEYGWEDTVKKLTI